MSIIIPTFRRKESLFKLLNALQAQEDINLQILVIDQNPEYYWNEDELLKFQLIQRITLKIPNVSAARNVGFLNSIYDYLMFVDDDLLPDQQFCAKAYDIFANSKIKAFCPTVYAYEGLLTAENNYKLQHGTCFSTGIYTIAETLSACLLFENAYFKLTGGFDPVLFSFAGSTEDQEFFKRMMIRQMPFYHVEGLSIFHDDKTLGGCDLRSQDYWSSRYKFMKGWVYRYAMHDATPGQLSAISYIRLLRSAFFNKQGLSHGYRYCKRQFGLLRKAIRETKMFIKSIHIKATALNVNFMSIPYE